MGRSSSSKLPQKKKKKHNSDSNVCTDITTTVLIQKYPLVQPSGETQQNLYSALSTQARSSSSTQPQKKKQKHDSDSNVCTPITTVLIQKYPLVQPSGDTQQIFYSALSMRQVMPNKYVHVSSLWLLKINHEFVDKLSKIGWSDLMMMNEPTYKDLTIEFLSSFAVNNEGEISFRIGNIQHEITRATLASMFGWQLAEQQGTPVNYATPFWLKITGLPSTEKYAAQRAASSEIISHSYRYFHRLMSYTIYGRSESNGKVQKGELALLYYFAEEILVDWTSLLIKRFLYQAKRQSGALVMGGFVTRIAERLGVFDRHNTSLKAVEGWSSVIDEEYLYGMKMLCRPNTSGLGPIRHKRDPVRVEGELENDTETDNTLKEQTDNTLKEQVVELQRGQTQLLKNQERIEQQIKDMFAYIQAHLPHRAP